MSKSIIFLADGMADEPLAELGGKTPLEAVDTPFMDSLAAKGASGTFLTLPKGFPTSSDVANMSVLGYDLSKCYTGRGPLEAASIGIQLGGSDIAFRCNLVEVLNGILLDYSAGHIETGRSREIMVGLQKNFGSEKVSFHAGVSYRNLLVLHGKEFSEKVMFHKPDSSQGEKLSDLALKPGDSSEEAAHTVKFLNALIAKTSDSLENHASNRNMEHKANMIWPWSPGRKPNLEPFADKYPGSKGAVISAVDVIFGLALCAKMDIIRVPGATGFIDTNYKGKADAAVKALNDHDFVYLHIEAIDECSHMGDLKLKMQAIKDFDSKIVGPVMSSLEGQDVTFAVIPDHPVPIKLRKHTRTPVPFAICGKHTKPDSLQHYSETLAPKGALGHLKGDEFMKLVLNIN
ncbi:MAG: cofactor-independent phosphoglycerate mutase [Victivallales bacterium]